MRHAILSKDFLWDSLFVQSVIRRHLHIECYFPSFMSSPHKIAPQKWENSERVDEGTAGIVFISECDLMTHKDNDVSFTEQEFPHIDVISVISHSVYCVTSVVRFESRWHFQRKTLVFTVLYPLFLFSCRTQAKHRWPNTISPSIYGSGLPFRNMDLGYRSPVLCSRALLAMVDQPVCSHAAQHPECLHHHIDICSWSLTHGWWSCFTSHRHILRGIVV